MHSIQIVMTRMRHMQKAHALHWQGQEYSYAMLFEMIDSWNKCLAGYQIQPGSVVGILGDYSPQICALFFALLQSGSILVPFTRTIEKEIPSFMEISGVEHLFHFEANDEWSLQSFPGVEQNNLVTAFKERRNPGLIVFTSGSTGKPKGILHDGERVMRKFITQRPGWRTLLFLMMDHFGGFNTFLSTFAYGGVGICAPERTPEAICNIIQESKAALLPTTPTFLNLLIASGCYRSVDLSSVKMITYGTEVMPEATLAKIRTIFPGASVKQTYGLSELGVLRSKSESDNSLWVKVGGDGFEVKVVDNTLWVRSESNMVGYLNAPSPFDADGWMCTGDQVEAKGAYLRFLGRKSEMINVGGQKVFPVEVETLLLQDANVREATVYGVKHELMGQVVHARISLCQPENADFLTERLRRFCLERVAKYKVPLRFHIVSEEDQRSERFKKIRRIAGDLEK